MSSDLTALNGVHLNAADFNALPTEKLREILTVCLRNQADNLVTMARAVKALEDRGEDLSPLRIALLPKLRLIACGQLLPEVLTRGWPYRLVRFVTRLPLDEQRRFVDGDPLKVAVYAPDGKEVTHRLVEILDLERPEQADLRKQVYADDHVRTLAEQALVLDQQRAKAKTFRSELVEGGRIDREQECVWFSRKPIGKATLKAWLKALEK